MASGNMPVSLETSWATGHKLSLVVDAPSKVLRRFTMSQEVIGDLVRS